MYMNYITLAKHGVKERLIAVIGDDREAKNLINILNEAYDAGFYYARSLNNILKNVEIPLHLKWIVESDNKFQQRELELRFGNITGENALTSKPE